MPHVCAPCTMHRHRNHRYTRASKRFTGFQRCQTVLCANPTIIRCVVFFSMIVGKRRHTYRTCRVSSMLLLGEEIYVCIDENQKKIQIEQDRHVWPRAHNCKFIRTKDQISFELRKSGEFYNGAIISDRHKKNWWLALMSATSAFDPYIWRTQHTLVFFPSTSKSTQTHRNALRYS